MSNNILRSVDGDDASQIPDAAPTESTHVDPALRDAGSPADAYHRARLYSLLSLALDRPDETHEAVYESDIFADDLLESASEYGEGDIREAAAQVIDELVTPTRLRADWIALFGVEEGVQVSPFQLTYLPGPLMTTIRDLADMKGFYQAFDLEIAEDERDRGDHIVFQTEFLSHLSLREAALRTQNDREGVEVVMNARQQFIEDHIGRWYWRFAQEVTKADETGFYAAVVELLATLLEHEIETMELEPEWVPDDPAVTEWNEGMFGESGRDCGGCGSDPGGPDPGRTGDPELLDEFGPSDEDELPDIDEYGPLSRTKTDDEEI